MEGHGNSGLSREQWATRIGLVLAMAGNAVGLGNFLRFPAQAARYGGGAFIIPYLCALLLLAMPLMWIEWAMGRYGGARGHGTTPAIFPMFWKHPIAKYIGVLGVFLPTTIGIYYVYVESWTLAYAFFSIKGSYFGILNFKEMSGFFNNFLGANMSEGLSLYKTAYIFFLITIVINVSVMYRGIARGIELLAKVAMPLLFVFAVILVIRVFTIGAPDPIAHPEWTVINGLGFLWNPNLSKLKEADVWLAAAGQVFFTLSIGFGAIQCYASYLREKDDVALTGLSTAATNEFAEIILGSCIAIPIAFAYFGPGMTTSVAQGGSFDIGFFAMPIIFQKIPMGQVFGALWFGLLFFAGITSSVALAQPGITFLQDELKLPRERAVLLFWGFIFVCVQLVIFGNGVLSEMDYWAANFGITFFGLIEIVIFMWIFKPQNAWDEINRGAQIRIPRFFRPVMTYITPLAALALFVAWTSQEFWDKLIMKDAPEEKAPWLMAARGLMLVTFIILVWLVAKSERIKKREGLK